MSKVAEDVVKQLRGRRLDEEDVRDILIVLRACYQPKSKSPVSWENNFPAPKEGQGM